MPPSLRAAHLLPPSGDHAVPAPEQVFLGQGHGKGQLQSGRLGTVCRFEDVSHVAREGTGRRLFQWPPCPLAVLWPPLVILDLEAAQWSPGVASAGWDDTELCGEQVTEPGTGAAPTCSGRTTVKGAGKF